MKAKTYYSAQAGNNAFDSSCVRPRPWDNDPTSPVGSTQIYYMWSSSIPHNWKLISARPVRKIRGEFSGKRDTLEFLRETQKYINTIRKPMRRIVEKSQSPEDQDAGESRRLPASCLRSAEGEDRRRIHTSKSPRFLLANSRSTDAPRTAICRIRSNSSLMSACGSQSLLESVLRDPGMAGFLKQQRLTPASSKKPKTSLNSSRFMNTRPMSFMERFNRAPNAQPAIPTSRGMLGSKLSNPALLRHKRTSSAISSSHLNLSPECSIAAIH